MENVNKYIEKFNKVLEENQRISKEGFFYTMPSNTHYPFQWLWDSCFTSIIYLKLNKDDLAKEEIKSLLEGQWENGMLPHIIYWNTNNKKHKVQWGVNKNTSSITQPPVIGFAVEKIYKKTKDKNFIKDVYERLDKYYKWLHNERSFDNIISILHPWETGEDDFINWDEIYKINNPSKEDLKKIKLGLLKKYIEEDLNSKEFLSKDIFNVSSLLFNSIYFRSLKSMFYLSKLINKNTEFYENLIENYKKSFRKNFYNEEIGLYYSFYYNNSKNNFFTCYDTSSLFLPLFAGLLDKEESEYLIKNYLFNEEYFWTKHPIPTASIKNKKFEPGRYWRGSTWVNINYLIYQGLKDYDFDKEAELLKNKTFELVDKFGFYEYYNSLTGDPKGPLLTWSGLILDFE